MMEVNATLVETLLDCLLEDWTCATVGDYVRGDLANMVSGEKVSVRACVLRCFLWVFLWVRVVLFRFL